MQMRISIDTALPISAEIIKKLNDEEQLTFNAALFIAVNRSATDLDDSDFLTQLALTQKLIKNPNTYYDIRFNNPAECLINITSYVHNKNINNEEMNRILLEVLNLYSQNNKDFIEQNASWIEDNAYWLDLFIKFVHSTTLYAIKASGAQDANEHLNKYPVEVKVAILDNLLVNKLFPLINKYSYNQLLKTVDEKNISYYELFDTPEFQVIWNSEENILSKKNIDKQLINS